MVVWIKTRTNARTGPSWTFNVYIPDEAVREATREALKTLYIAKTWAIKLSDAPPASSSCTQGWWCDKGEARAGCGSRHLLSSSLSHRRGLALTLTTTTTTTIPPLHSSDQKSRRPPSFSMTSNSMKTTTISPTTPSCPSTSSWTDEGS